MNFTVISQNLPPAPTQEDNEVFTKLKNTAQFKGGNSAWLKFLKANMNANVPMDNGAPAGTYTVILHFIVHKDGSISDISAETNFGYGIEAECIRVIKKSPYWIPGNQNGHVVTSYKRQPFTFVVQDQ